MFSKYIITGALYLLMFATGVVLTKKGKPYNMAVSAVHKLVSVAAIVFMVLTIIQLEKISGISAMQWVMIVVIGFFFIIAIGTGGFLAGHNEAPKPIVVLHKIAPLIVLVLSFVSLYSLATA